MSKMLNISTARLARLGAALLLVMLGLSVAPAAHAQVAGGAVADDPPMQMGNMPGMAAQSDCRTFTETKQTLCGKFLEYWNNHGGLAQQGYPISGEMQEQSATDGKTYTVQYFERAVFELHSENSAPNDVLLALLGNFSYEQKYPDGAPGQAANAGAGAMLFRETGKHLGGAFLQYWQQHGGLAQQGYPISEEFQEKSELDGKTYTVQYFERAVFEAHPANTPPYDVLLSQLGTFRYQQNYSGGTTPTAGKHVAVEISGLTFSPKVITINVGDTVTWTQRDAADHTVTSKTGLFDSKILTPVGATFSYTFTQAGTYNYFCAVHPFMLGTVIVNP